jgi:diphthine synthase
MRYGPPRFMNPQTAIEQILYTENERHPPSSSKSTSNTNDDDEEAKSTTSRASSPDPTLPQYPVYPTLLDPHKTLIMTLSRLGTPTQQIRSGTIEEMAHLTEEDFGGPLHSVVIVGGNSEKGKGRLHPLEAEYASRFAVNDGKEFWRCAKEDYGVERETI